MSEQGYVYFFVRPDGLLKVGHTKNLQNRLKAHGRNCKELIGVKEGCIAFERHCQAYLDPYRLPRSNPRSGSRQELFDLPEGKLNGLRKYLAEKAPVPPKPERVKRPAIRTEQMNFRCSPQFKAAAIAVASRRGCSIPDLMEALLAQSITRTEAA